MAKFFPVDPSVWNARVTRLGKDAVLVYLYVLSCPHRNSEGLFKLPRDYVVADLKHLGIDLSGVDGALQALEAEGLLAYDQEAEVVLDLYALYTAGCVSPSQIKGAIGKIRQVPKTLLLRELHHRATAHAEGLANALVEAFSDELKDPPDTVQGDSIETLPTYSVDTASRVESESESSRLEVESSSSQPSQTNGPGQLDTSTTDDAVRRLQEKHRAQMAAEGRRP